PIRQISVEQSWQEYKGLWEQYLNENPDLEQELIEKAQGKVLTDMFASTDVSQARALSELLNERGSGESIQTFEDFSELNDDELARQQFVAQRDELFRKYKVNNYWNNIGKKYTADSQKRFLEAN